jgi:hypothetical protein
LAEELLAEERTPVVVVAVAVAPPKELEAE